MPSERAENEALDVLDLVRMCRSALYHAEACLVETQYAYDQGRDPLPVYRAGSHHLKKARECFNAAVARCNILCGHSYPPKEIPKEYARESTAVDFSKLPDGIEPMPEDT